MTTPDVPDRDSLVQVGHLHVPYGIKGWVWVMSRTEPVANIFDYGPWILDRGGVLQVAERVGGRTQGKGLVASFAGIDDRNGAETLQGVGIWVPKAALPVLDEADYFWSELIDMQVITEQNVLLGQVHALMETGANDVIVVRACAGSVDAEERLLPWLPGRVIRFVDRVQKRITVDWDPSY